MLSVVICTHNEEKSLPRAVSSIKKIADEVIVVDTQSTDNTLAVAKKLGCKVFQHKYTGIVEPVRNFAISKAAGEWVLILDADEEITTALSVKISEIIASSDIDYCRIPRKNVIFNQWITTGHWWPDYVYRLFKKGYIHWQDTIHSIPITRGNGVDLPVREDFALVHHNYQTISQFVQRLDKYTEFQSRSLLASGYSFSALDVISKPMQEFISQYFARGGFKMGLHGLSLSLLQAFSELVTYLKVWQTGGFAAQAVSISAVQNILARQKGVWRWWWFQAKIDNTSFPVNFIWKVLRRLSK